MYKNAQGKKETYIMDKGNPWGYRYTVVIKRVRGKEKKVFTFTSSHTTERCANKAYEGKGKVVSRKMTYIPTGETMKEWSDTNPQERTL